MDGENLQTSESVLNTEQSKCSKSVSSYFWKKDPYPCVLFCYGVLLWILLPTISLYNLDTIALVSVGSSVVDLFTLKYGSKQAQVIKAFY